ncbi:hypothetical protein BDW22DRAFT_1360412 [Trametopsis cervina]|nr:hypothetical protein BDW22DRAFT_1360412 [Trametopsis cervina]
MHRDEAQTDVEVPATPPQHTMQFKIGALLVTLCAALSATASPVPPKTDGACALPFLLPVAAVWPLMIACRDT